MVSLLASLASLPPAGEAEPIEVLRREELTWSYRQYIYGAAGSMSAFPDF